MPFIGQEPITGAFHKLDAITTSSTNTYNLLLNGGAYSPASANHLMVSLNGVIQSPGDSFTVSGSQITFVPSSGTLSSSDSIDFIMAYGDVLNIGTPSDGSVNTNQLANSAVTDAKIAGMSSSKLTGALPAVDGSSLTGVGGFVFLASTTVTSNVSEIIFNNTYITSTYSSYKIIMDGIQITGGGEWGIQLSPDNGTTFRSSGYHQNRRRHYTTNAGSSYVSDINHYTTHILYDSPGTGDSNLADITLGQVTTAEKTLAIQLTGFGDANTYHTFGYSTGRYDTAEAHNAIRFFTGSGNFSGGTISLFGVKK